MHLTIEMRQMFLVKHSDIEWHLPVNCLLVFPCPCLCFDGRWQFALGIHYAYQERRTENVKVMLYFLCIMGHTNELYILSEESNSYLCENVIPANNNIYLWHIFWPRLGNLQDSPGRQCFLWVFNPDLLETQKRKSINQLFLMPRF